MDEIEANLVDILFEEALARAIEALFEGTFDDFFEIFKDMLAEEFVRVVWDRLIEWGPQNLVALSAFAPMTFSEMACSISVTTELSSPYNVFDNGDSVRILETQPEHVGRAFSMPLRDTIGIYILSPSKAVTRLLDLFVKSTLFNANATFWPEGSSRPYWISTAELAPVDVGGGTETVLKYGRKQTWACETNLQLRTFGRPQFTKKPILVHTEGTFVDATADAATRTYTPLVGKTPGGVKPQ
jgi:hypothetical protein